MPTPSAILIESCLELGSLTEDQVLDALAGTANHPHIKAIISWIEYKIGTEHATLSTRGLTAETRHEAAGAADALKALRTDFLAFTRAGLHDTEAQS